MSLYPSLEDMVVGQNSQERFVNSYLNNYSSSYSKPGTKASTGSTISKCIEQWASNNVTRHEHHAISSSKPSSVKIDQLMRVSVDKRRRLSLTWQLHGPELDGGRHATKRSASSRSPSSTSSTTFTGTCTGYRSCQSGSGLL